jgi:Fur family iron response transcriptional regulator
MQAARERLRASGLRPTRQRLMLAWILFGNGDRHVSAEQLHEEARRARVQVSLATIYNTLHGFAARGLLREVSGIAGRSWFDTNTRDHQHFVHEETGELFDVEGNLAIGHLPEPPPGYEIAGLDIVVRLRRAR